MAKFALPYVFCYFFSQLLIIAYAAETLYASHYSGQIYLLSLSDSGSLTITASITGGGSLPSWLTYDGPTKTLYCSDEQMFGSGSISSFSIGSDGRLTQTGKATAPYGGVANTLYGGSDGKGFIAIAHYQSSTVSTFKLPLTSSSQPQQTFKFTLSGLGTIPSRQDAPHPHHVVTDPTGNFLFAPDLGADLIRMWSIDRTSGTLTACNPVSVKGGTGPRHATFWMPASATAGGTGTMMFVANELANTVNAFSVSYAASGCPSLTLTQSMSPFPSGKTAPSGTKVAEVHVKDSFLYNTNRVDKSFSGNDSVTAWTISSTGTIAEVGFTDSYGTYPRTFSINSAGTLVAIGDQTTANVAIVARNTTTGLLGNLVANLRIGSTGTPENEDGLSSVVFAV